MRFNNDQLHLLFSAGIDVRCPAAVTSLARPRDPLQDYGKEYIAISEYML
jgi:hypothetical protein